MESIGEHSLKRIYAEYLNWWYLDVPAKYLASSIGVFVLGLHTPFLVWTHFITVAHRIGVLQVESASFEEVVAEVQRE